MYISFVTGIKIGVIISNIFFRQTLDTPVCAIAKTKRFFAGTAIYRLLCIQVIHRVYLELSPAGRSSPPT